MDKLKDRLQNDLAVAIKARDQTTTATLRMALAAVTNQEVAGKQARALSDDEVLQVLAKEAKKRAESAEAFDAAGRAELADQERAERAVLEQYLPAQLSDEELAALVRDAIASTGASGPSAMGAVMKAVQPVVAGRAEGRRIAAEVKNQLSN